jgi:hypothetical protein
VIPDTSALVILLGLVPGWIFWTLRSRYRPRGSRTNLAEVLELVAVSALTTGAAIAIWVLTDGLRIPGVLSPSDWARSGDSYLVDHLVSAVVTLALIVVLACALSLLLHKAIHRGKGEHDAEEFVWWKAFTDRPKGTFPYVGLMLDDGVFIEGFLRAFTTEGSESGREIALAAPIRVAAKDGAPVKQTVDGVVVPEQVIRYVTVLHTNPPSVVTGS